MDAPKNTIEIYKDAFNRNDGLIHLNNAGVAPWPKQTENAIKEWASKIASEGTHGAGTAFDKAGETRQLLATTLGAKQDQIAFFQTCATAISQVAFGLQLPKHAEIITFDQEYPSDFYPWKLAADRAEGKLIVAKSDASLATPVESIKKHVTDKTKVIAVSWVQYRNGAITDLAELAKFARANNILTCVDIIQGAGLMPFDFTKLGLDFACGGAHKWFTSPLSLGFLMMRPELIETLTPLSVGAMTFGGYDKLSDIKTPISKGYARYEPGGRSLLELIGFGETLKLVQATTVEKITQETERLSNRLIAGLKERGYTVNSPHAKEHRGSIVNFSPSNKSALKTIEDVDTRLTQNKVSYTKRPPGVRLSPHAFVTTEQIDKVLEALS